MAEQTPEINCNHSYARPITKETGLMFCLDCHQYFTVQRHTGQPIEAPFALPGVHFEIPGNGDWLDLKRRVSEQEGKPFWKEVPFAVVSMYGWYISIIGDDEYLIMPVKTGRKPVFYSARRLTNNGGMKYWTPPGAHKYPWISHGLHGVVAASEGIADAAHVSQLLPSIGLMGSYYLPDLDPFMRHVTHVLILMDGDVRGIMAAARLVYSFGDRGVRATPIYLDEGLDPTDVPIRELRRMLEPYGI